MDIDATTKRSSHAITRLAAPQWNLAERDLRLVGGGANQYRHRRSTQSRLRKASDRSGYEARARYTAARLAVRSSARRSHSADHLLRRWRHGAARQALFSERL